MLFSEQYSLIHGRVPSDHDDSSSFVESPVGEMEKSLKREIHLARDIQTKLLNGKTPKLSKGEVTGVSIPARLIGGDYYDFYLLPNDKLRIVIGDVMGKGIPAAMLMILTRGAFRSAADSAQGPGATLTAMNNALCEDLRTLGSFVTVLCADWDPNTDTLTYANAGHSLPVLIRETKKVEEMPKNNGVMLGGLPNQIYQEKQVYLHRGDDVFFYTDGIIEAQNKRGEQYKLYRLIDVLLQHSNKSVHEIEQMVVNSTNEFTEGMPQKDDLTMVILKVGKDKANISSCSFA
ncbi:MAG: PP2C family protein-serine/threonine phosphatase [Desulfitobacteriaceae bacterium]|nr:PP2C family protein-serine/threonine phosphatase [Desulfitobacteriaceae bacterium]MDI6916067.1 PP2C family protein-serine/threonine phosphatase [Desulfitobacteriaceae bacterium]